MPRWTSENRKKQVEAIKFQQPWKHATGPRTAEGKAVSARNATRHALFTEEGKELMRTLARQRRFLRRIMIQSELEGE